MPDALRFAAYLFAALLLAGVVGALLQLGVRHAVRNQEGRLFQIAKLLHGFAALVCTVAALVAVVMFYQRASAPSIVAATLSAAYVALYQFEKYWASQSDG